MFFYLRRVIFLLTIPPVLTWPNNLKCIPSSSVSGTLKQRIYNIKEYWTYLWTETPSALPWVTPSPRINFLHRIAQSSSPLSLNTPVGTVPHWQPNLTFYLVTTWPHGKNMFNGVYSYMFSHFLYSNILSSALHVKFFEC